MLEFLWWTERGRREQPCVCSLLGQKGNSQKVGKEREVKENKGNILQSKWTVNNAAALNLPAVEW